jgi:1-acyl-sn-glycerol-3-phosphate acyltransferase
MTTEMNALKETFPQAMPRSPVSLFRRVCWSVKGSFAAFLLGLNVLVVFLSMLPLAILKLIVRLPVSRRLANRILNFQAELWVAVNNAWIALVGNRNWSISALPPLQRKGSYLVICNHQSWVDIFILQRVFFRQIPLLKFFLKRELLFVPVIGLAWWALDFPFLRRQVNAKGMENDLRAARKACERFRDLPVSLVSFIEGTRFSEDKRAIQRSPYRHLLKPKLGALGMSVATLADRFDLLIDVTIAYPDGVPRFWDLLAGKVEGVQVFVRTVEIPESLTNGTLIGKREWHKDLGRWIQSLWHDKDALLSDVLEPNRLRQNGEPQ